jgi:hypothetical protein
MNKIDKYMIIGQMQNLSRIFFFKGIILFHPPILLARGGFVVDPTQTKSGEIVQLDEIPMSQLSH